MELSRLFLRLTVVLVAVPLWVGCDSTAPQPPPASSSAVPSSPQPASGATAGFLNTAKQKLTLQEFDAAAEAAYKALVQDPNSAEATAVASQIEAGRGNHQVALELASSIDLKSPFGKDAVDVHANSLVKLERVSEAADVLLKGISEMPEMVMWRHRAWELLNRVGRRHDASMQAEMLTVAGLATQSELLSLIRRSWSFPFSLDEGDEPEQRFEPGLGMARWYFTKLDYQRAIDELANQFQSEFESPAASALYGRLLMERQSFEDFRQWHAKCDDRVQAFADYWAALGIYFFDHQQYPAAARAWLEAVYRDPTDRETLQRLYKVFGSLERLDEGDQFRNRGVKVSATEKIAQQIALLPAERVLKLELARSLAELGRPFEMLQWSKLVLTPANQRERAQIDSQIEALRNDERAMYMASAVSLSGVEMDQYSVEPALTELKSSSQQATQGGAASVSTLATPSLVDVAKEVGIDFQWYQDVEINLQAIPIHESLGGGIGVMDYDLDGWPDIYLVQGSGDPPTDKCTRSDVMVRNLQGNFVEVTSSADLQDFHFGSGVTCGDTNQDGFADLWIGSLGHNRLLLNNGDGTFREITDRLNCDDQFTSSLAIADINGDSLPDLFEANYIDMEGGFALPGIGPDGKPKLPGPLAHLSGFDRWFQNLGNGEFQTHVIPLEVSEPGTSLGVVVTDFDANGVNEVFVGNDVRPNHFLFHQGNNRMANLSDVKGVANGFKGVPNGCMGISAADFSRDGLIDIFITNYYNEANNMFIQNSSGLFADVAIRYGISDLSIPMVGFGTKGIDFDRNGWLDLAISNGHIFDTRSDVKGGFFEMPPQMLMSVGRRFELAEVDDRSGYWDQMYLGRAMTSFDFNRDGAMDLLIGHLDKPLALLRNETKSPGRWLQLELIGTRCERDAIGARVVVHAGEESFTQWVTAGDGYLCSDEPVLDFGLGVTEAPLRVEVHWPGGEVQSWDALEANHRYLIVQGETTTTTRQQP